MTSCRNVVVLLLGAVLLSGCRLPLPAPSGAGDQVAVRDVQGLPVTIEYAQQDARSAALVEEGVRAGVEACKGWGRLDSPLRIVVYSSPREMQAAVGKERYTWLTAWATEKDIALISPDAYPKNRDYKQFVVHEMTHAIHYQTANIPASLVKFNDPAWFREGLASVVARQESLRYPRTRLKAMLEQHPRFDPLKPSEDDMRNRQPLVYSCGHSMVAFLIELHGLDKIREFLQRMGRISLFESAFVKTFGVSSEAFKQRWLASL